MDWLPIATAVVGLLAPYAAKAGEEIAKKLGGEAYDALKKRFWFLCRITQSFASSRVHMWNIIPNGINNIAFSSIQIYYSCSPSCRIYIISE